MGMMSEAMAGMLGGISGGAQAASASVATSMKQMHDEALQRMQQDFENQRQGTQIQAEKDIEAQKETYETGQTQTKLKAAVGAASATRLFESQENAANRASREKIGEGHDLSKEDVAAINAAVRSAGANKTLPFQYKTQTYYPKNPDGSINYAGQAHTVAHTFDPNAGVYYNQVGNKLYGANEDGESIDARTGKVLDTKSTNNQQPDKADLKVLMQDPYGVVPSGYKNGGMTNLENFKATYGYIPTQVLGTMRALSQQRGQPITIQLPSGRPYTIPAGTTSANVSGNEIQPPPGADPQEAQEESGSDQPFQSNAMNTYGAVSGQ
jgi:hypothetical protein